VRHTHRFKVIHVDDKNILGLRGIEWVIFGLKTRETWGLQGDSAF
jgi:hypothetical protein